MGHDLINHGYVMRPNKNSDREGLGSFQVTEGSMSLRGQNLALGILPDYVPLYLAVPLLPL